jgi:hypothetical protein
MTARMKNGNKKSGHQKQKGKPENPSSIHVAPNGAGLPAASRRQLAETPET